MSMEMSVAEQERYVKSLEKGQVYQDYVVAMLIKHKGIVLSNFSSLLFQYGIGEGYQGFEIKLDLPSKETGRLLIETGRRSSVNDDWKDSGIYRNDNAEFYIVGNYGFFYLFDVKVLRRIEKSKNFFREDSSDTGKWFLLEQSVIEKDPPYICKVICGEFGKKLLEGLQGKANHLTKKINNQGRTP